MARPKQCCLQTNGQGLPRSRESKAKTPLVSIGFPGAEKGVRYFVVAIDNEYAKDFDFVVLAQILMHEILEGTGRSRDEIYLSQTLEPLLNDEDEDDPKDISRLNKRIIQNNQRAGRKAYLEIIAQRGD